MPIVKNFSFGLRELIVGRPFGLQGEIQAQWGLTPTAAPTYLFHQEGHDPQLVVESFDDEGAPTNDVSASRHTVQLSGNGSNPVEVFVGLQTVGPPDGSTPLSDWKARFEWPDGTTEVGDRASGDITHGDTLKVTPIEVVDIDGTPTDIAHQPTHEFTFVRQVARPSVDADVDGDVIADITHLGGVEADLEHVTLTARPATPEPPNSTSEYTWQWRSRSQTGPTYQVFPFGLRGDQQLRLTQRITLENGAIEEHTTRVIVTIVDDDATDNGLLVGAPDGVRRPLTDPGTIIPLSAVVGQFAAARFHTQGERLARATGAQLTGTSPFVEVDTDVIAEVVVGDPAPRQIPRDRHVQVLFNFDEPDDGTGPTGGTSSWGEHRPSFIAQSPDASPAFDAAMLRQWAAQFPDAEFVVVGRCGDLGDEIYNTGLAGERAEAIRLLLSDREAGVVYPDRQEPVDEDRIFARGEQSDYATEIKATGEALELEPQEWTPTEGLPPVNEPLLLPHENFDATEDWLIIHEQDPASNDF
ncbi:MAG: hypothetical protein AAFP84_22740, partial [Actinomycetota bacterium]